MAYMGQALTLKPSAPADPDRSKLADLVPMIWAEKNRARAVQDSWIETEITSLLTVLNAHLGRIESQIEGLIVAHKPLAAASQRIRSMTGIGPAIGGPSGPAA